MRGWLALALSASAAGWWLVQWLLDQPLEPGKTGLVAVVVAAVGGHLGWLNVRRRLRRGPADTSTPTPRVVYETRADAGARRIRFSGAVFLTAMIVLVFDTLATWYGIRAGVVAGAALDRVVAGFGVDQVVAVAAAERVGRTVEREIVQPDFLQKIEPRADFREQRVGNRPVFFVVFERGEKRLGVGHGEGRDFVTRPAGHAHASRLGPQPRQMPVHADETVLGQVFGLVARPRHAVAEGDQALSLIHISEPTRPY